MATSVVDSVFSIELSFLTFTIRYQQRYSSIPKELPIFAPKIKKDLQMQHQYFNNYVQHVYRMRPTHARFCVHVHWFSGFI